MRIGIDLGGTKIAGIVLRKDGAKLAHERVSAPKDNYTKTLEAVCALVKSLENKCGGGASIGVAMPGSLSPSTGLVRNSNSTWLNGQNLKQDLQKSLEREVRFANDANCFALSEATDGAGRDAASVFGVIIGTGCGGGLVINGQIVDGARGIGGEWGHTPLPWREKEETPGPTCWCGREGCMETLVSGSGLEANYKQTFGESLSAKDIAEKARDGCPKARETLNRHVSMLARGLGAIVNIVDPACIVLGGGLSQMAHLYEQLPGLMAPYIFSDIKTIDILPPLYGDDSGVRGAAWLWGGSNGEKTQTQ